MNRDIRIGALISGSGTNLQAIMDTCESGQIRGSVVFIGTDNPGAAGLKKGEKLDISTLSLIMARLFDVLKITWKKIKLPDDLISMKSFQSNTLPCRCR